MRINKIRIELHSSVNIEKQINGEVIIMKNGEEQSQPFKNDDRITPQHFPFKCRLNPYELLLKLLHIKHTRYLVQPVKYGHSLSEQEVRRLINRLGFTFDELPILAQVAENSDSIWKNCSQEIYYIYALGSHSIWNDEYLGKSIVYLNVPSQDRGFHLRFLNDGYVNDCCFLEDDWFLVRRKNLLSGIICFLYQLFQFHPAPIRQV